MFFIIDEVSEFHAHKSHRMYFFTIFLRPRGTKMIDIAENTDLVRLKRSEIEQWGKGVDRRMGGANRISQTYVNNARDSLHFAGAKYYEQASQKYIARKS